MSTIKVLLALMTLSLSISAKAFSEMIRFGYVNCTACHVSPHGGGLMTDYGRSLSAEVLSRWKYEKEELPGHGFLPDPPAWLKLGGDVRVIQTYVDNPQATVASAFPMQIDFEFGVNSDKFWYVQSLGVQGGPDNFPGRGEFAAHRYYFLYNWTDLIYSRVGKYILPYGLIIPDHTSFIKRQLGFDQGQEAYNADIGMIGEVWNVILTASFGRRDSSNINLEKGGALQVARNLGDARKIQGSLAYLTGEGIQRYLLGPQVLWGFNSQWVFLGEYDYQEKVFESGTNPVQKGIVTYSRLQYEWTKGLNIYLLHQLSYLDFTQLRTRVNSTGAGLIFYPRPHLELNAEVDYSETAEVNIYNTVAWLMGHYYF